MGKATGKATGKASSSTTITGQYEPLCVGVKTCLRCGESKHVLHFAVDRRNRDGLRGVCRECGVEKVPLPREWPG